MANQINWQEYGQKQFIFATKVRIFFFTNFINIHNFSKFPYSSATTLPGFLQLCPAPAPASAPAPAPTPATVPVFASAVAPTEASAVAPAAAVSASVAHPFAAPTAFPALTLSKCLPVG